MLLAFWTDRLPKRRPFGSVSQAVTPSLPDKPNPAKLECILKVILGKIASHSSCTAWQLSGSSQAVDCHFNRQLMTTPITHTSISAHTDTYTFKYSLPPLWSAFRLFFFAVRISSGSKSIEIHRISQNINLCLPLSVRIAVRVCVCGGVMRKHPWKKKKHIAPPVGSRHKYSRPWSLPVLFQPLPHLGHMHMYAWSKVSCRKVLISVYGLCMSPSL